MTTTTPSLAGQQQQQVVSPETETAIDPVSVTAMPRMTESERTGSCPKENDDVGHLHAAAAAQQAEQHRDHRKMKLAAAPHYAGSLAAAQMQRTQQRLQTADAGASLTPAAAVNQSPNHETCSRCCCDCDYAVCLPPAEEGSCCDCCRSRRMTRGCAAAWIQQRPAEQQLQRLDEKVPQRGDERSPTSPKYGQQQRTQKH